MKYKTSDHPPEVVVFGGHHEVVEEVADQDVVGVVVEVHREAEEMEAWT